MSIRYTSFTGLCVSLEKAVLTVKLDNPPLNALSDEAHSELGSIWALAGSDPDVRVIVLTGGGDRAFCAGGDLNRLIENVCDQGRWQLVMSRARAIIVGMLECSKPVISRINGHAMGVGATMALAGDITIIVDDAKIGDSHINIGLATGGGGSLLWPNLVGLVEARRNLLSGKPLSGADAQARGLVTEAVSRDILDTRVQHWVDMFLSQSHEAVQATKETLNLEMLDKAKRYMDDMLRLETVSWGSPNHPEAVRAILEKRPPCFVNVQQSGI